MSTWTINEMPEFPESTINQEINFVANNQNFKRIVINNYYNASITITYTNLSNQSYEVYTRSVTSTNAVLRAGDPTGTINWSDYRTVGFVTEPTGELLTWLQSNAVKEASYEGEIDSITLNGTTYDLEDNKTHPVIMTTSDSQVSGTTIDMNGLTGANIWAAYDQGTPIKVIDTNRRLVYNCVGYTTSGSSRIFNFTSTNSNTYHYFTLWLSEAAASGLINAPGSMDSVKKTMQALSSIGLSGTKTVTLSDGYSILNLVFPLQGRYVSTAIPADSLTTTAVPVQVADQLHYAVWNVSRSGNTITFVFNRKYSSTSASLTGMIYESQ